MLFYPQGYTHSPFFCGSTCRLTPFDETKGVPLARQPEPQSRCRAAGQTSPGPGECEFAKSEQGDTSSRSAYKVCAVALDLTSNDSVALFSGNFGFKQLLQQPNIGGGRKGDVTSAITTFLKSPAGGAFTEEQINKIAYAQHDRGAVNCAEPKVWFYLTDRKLSTRNWILIPFAKQDGELVYSPPCENCRRWVYGHFHFLSRLTAASYGGPGALAPGKLRKK